MAFIRPFAGLRYNQDKVANLASVVTPPYDIIDEKAQAKYYAENPFNIIRLELGMIFPDDSEDNNRYTRAKKYLDKWLKDEILVQEKKPALYFYQQEFNGPSGKMVRNGFVCGLRVEDYEKGNILPHEETLSKPKQDRLQLMRATQCNFSSIFGLYNDPDKVVDSAFLGTIGEKNPDIEIEDESGEWHRIWVVTNEQVIDQVVDFMQSQKVFIADGHHRYETALTFCKEMEASGISGYDYVMTTLVNLHDPGLVILPTHRLVGNLVNFDLEGFKTAIEPLFEVEERGTKNNVNELLEEMAQKGRRKHVFGMYANDGKLYFLTLRHMNQVKKFLPKDKSDAWKRLDVALLDHIILEHFLGIGEEQRKAQAHLEYTRDPQMACAIVDEGKYQLAFFLNPTKVQEVVKVAEAKDKMPQKSTYFYPKLITGLIINPLFKNTAR